MQTIKTIGLDIAKSVFQVHGVDGDGGVVVRRQLIPGPQPSTARRCFGHHGWRRWLWRCRRQHKREPHVPPVWPIRVIEFAVGLQI